LHFISAKSQSVILPQAARETQTMTYVTSLLAKVIREACTTTTEH